MPPIYACAVHKGKLRKPPITDPGYAPDLSYKFAKYEHLQLYCQWATIYNVAINIANIEDGKIARAHSQLLNVSVTAMYLLTEIQVQVATEIKECLLPQRF